MTMIRAKRQERVVIRQAILDHIHKHGPQSRRQLSEALGVADRAVNLYLKEMRDDHEVRVVREELHGRYVVPFYEARVTTTKVTVAGTMPAKPVELSEVTHQIAPGHIRHQGTHRDRPLKDSGGQGRISSRSTMGSSLGDGLMRVTRG